MPHSNLIFAFFLLLMGCQNSSSESTQSSESVEATSDTIRSDDEGEYQSVSGQRESSEVLTEIAKCAIVEGALVRLDCYDKVAEAFGLTQRSTTLASGPEVGQWQVSIDTNPIDDSQTVLLVLNAEEVRSRYGDPVSLMLRCKSNGTEVYINWNDYLGGEAEVTTRVGDSPAQTRRWLLSTDSKATFHPGNEISFIMSLMESDQFVAQVTPYSESPVTSVFNTTGLEKAVEPLRETCGW